MGENSKIYKIQILQCKTLYDNIKSNINITYLYNEIGKEKKMKRYTNNEKKIIQQYKSGKKVKELSEEYNVCTGTVYNWIRNGHNVDIDADMREYNKIKIKKLKQENNTLKIKIEKLTQTIIRLVEMKLSK